MILSWHRAQECDCGQSNEHSPSRTQSEEASRVCQLPCTEPPLKLLGLNYCWKKSTRDPSLAGMTPPFLNSDPILVKVITGQPSFSWFAEVCLSFLT